MRTSLENIQKIDAYIANELSNTEMLVMKESLAQSSELNEIYQNQLMIQQAVNRKAILAQVQHFGGGSSLSFWSKFKWPLILSFALLGLIGILWATSNSQNSTKKEENLSVQNEISKPKVELESTPSVDSVFQDSSHPALAEMMQKYPNLNNYKAVQPSLIEQKIDYPDGLKTWVSPEVQTFQFNAQKTNTLECKEGTLIIVPANAVLDKSGKKAQGFVSMEIIEALTIDKMIAYNLTTTNGDKALTSGGMIYIQPIVDGEKGSFDKDTPCHIEIPTDDFNGEMSSWKGIVNEKGNIDWEQAKTLENYLIPVDFALLEFLPKGFRNHFQAQLPFENFKKSSKELEDSVYYSLGAKNEFHSKSFVSEPSKRSEMVQIDTIAFASQPYEFPVKIASKEKKSSHSGTIVVENYNPSNFKNPNLVFITNKKEYNILLNAEGYAEIAFPTDKPYKGSIVAKMIECDSVVLRNVDLQLYKVTRIDLSKAECLGKITAVSSNKIAPTCYINPSTIKTIRQPKFAKTFIATREFEERLQLLHGIENGEPLLELYIQNLEKNLYEVDHMVANKLSGAKRLIFQTLANEKLTNVKLDLANLKEIQEYYHATRLKFHQEAQDNEAKLNQKTLAELRKLDGELAQVQTEYFAQFQKNLPHGNMPTSKRRIAILPIIKPVKPSVSNNTSYKVSWFNTGWMNIDSYSHILSKGEKTIAISSKNENERVYQCINSLKTIVGLTNQSGKYEGHYPSISNPENVNFNSTYCVGIARNAGRISFASAIFNANEVNSVDLKYENVSEEEMLDRLKTLSPFNDRLAQEIKDERERIQKAEVFKAKQEAILVERNKIIAKKEKHDQFIQGLIDFINPCSENQSEKRKQNKNESKSNYQLVVPQIEPETSPALQSKDKKKD